MLLTERPLFALIAMPELRYFFIALAAELHRRHGAVFHVFVSTKEEVEFYRSRDPGGIFAIIENSEHAARYAPAGEADHQLISDAQGWEKRLGVTFATLAVSHRHFGRGFALAGSGHPVSRLSEEFDLSRTTRAYLAQCEFWTKRFENHRYAAVLNGGALVGAFAKLHSVPLRVMLGSRYENFHYWAHDHFFYTPEVSAAWQGLKDIEPSADILRPYLIERVHQAKFRDAGSIFGLGIKLAKFISKRAYHKLRGYEKAKGYRLVDTLRMIIRNYQHLSLMRSEFTVPLEKLKSQPFLFFPLQTEPEASLGQISPEFFFQHAAIAAVARDLPAGWVLAVKETIHGVGRRPHDFYRQIADLKNVVWLDIYEYGLDVVKASCGVVTITGTAGMEAAVMGKPVIAFGHHNIYGMLDHVHDAADITNLVEPIKRITSGAIDQQKALRDGARYLAAVIATSFDMRGYDYITREKFDEASVTDAADALMRSLEGRYEANMTGGNEAVPSREPSRR